MEQFKVAHLWVVVVVFPPLFLTAWHDTYGTRKTIQTVMPHDKVSCLSVWILNGVGAIKPNLEHSRYCVVVKTENSTATSKKACSCNVVSVLLQALIRVRDGIRESQFEPCICSENYKRWTPGIKVTRWDCMHVCDNYIVWREIKV